jgi:hypothetical protein
MRAKPLGLWLCVLLAGCAASRQQTPPRWEDPASEQMLRSLLCQLDRRCRWLRFRLYDLDAPLAEIRYRFEIVISRGLLERTLQDAERAFVLAHELAHLHLDHRPPRGAEERLAQELAADAWAAQRLRDTGFNGAAGAQLLQRLCGELARSEPAPAHAAAALAEYAQRLHALARITPWQDAADASRQVAPCGGIR